MFRRSRSRLEQTSFAGALALAACSGAQNGQAPAESAEAPQSETPGATSGPSDGPGDGEASPPVAAPHGKRAPCSSDQSCNEDPAVSALWGRCTEMGICECNPGFERSPTSDSCRPVPAQ
jgi:hypothetical protein